MKRYLVLRIGNKRLYLVKVKWCDFEYRDVFVMAETPEGARELVSTEYKPGGKYEFALGVVAKVLQK